MREIKTIDDLIRAKGLTTEEQKNLGDIIEECRVRETRIREASEAAKRHLEGLSQTFSMVVDMISRVNRAVDDLNDQVDKLQLRMMPEEQFFQA